MPRKIKKLTEQETKIACQKEIEKVLKKYNADLVAQCLLAGGTTPRMSIQIVIQKEERKK